MSRTILPPTPQPSTDITAKSAPPLSGLELSFSLPPPALDAIVPSDLKAVSTCYFDSSASTSSSSSSSSNSYQPLSPTSPGIAERDNTPADAPKKRRRSSTLGKPEPQPPAQKRRAKEIALPPPPSRPRKIIQMRPRQSSSSSASSADGPGQSTPPEPKKPRKAAAKADKPGDDEKPTTAVGRKIARKTAHSLIERRRRFKMNEEFGVLKGMIPACKGVEMHKLAILQASIEYLRYLERCVEDLRASNAASSNFDEAHALMLPPPPRNREERDSEEDSEEGEEVEEEEKQAEKVESIAPSSLTPSMLVSPCLYPPRGPAPSQVSQSPVVYPQGHQHDPVDTEATHALLLLADRRMGGNDEPRDSPCSAGSSSSRGMSVKDLLSS
ncbi:unnamed protein product [Tuber aestivum]|uniref:BHLH domain-containing protein n=1 Tax=Tuber aestivum TaxID=59557 RepID=A0A292PK11_9PEZI|nr:unnamed protein product [Tuber aestivum]